MLAALKIKSDDLKALNIVLIVQVSDTTMMIVAVTACSKIIKLIKRFANPGGGWRWFSFISSMRKNEGVEQ